MERCSRTGGMNFLSVADGKFLESDLGIEIHKFMGIDLSFFNTLI